MNRLGSLDNVATYSIRKFFSHLIKATFYHQHQTPCPRHLCSVRDLSFLPKLIGTDIHWKEISISSLSNYLQLTPDRLRVLIDNPQSLRTNQQECLTAGRSFLEYRLSVQQDLPTRLKHVYTWNLNSWNAPGPPIRDPKTRRCRRLLQTGPVCLQETKWDGGAPERIAGYLPGTKIFSSTCTLLESGKRSGGVAILLPPGWKAEKSHEPVPSRALALLVRDRITQFYLVSVYLHPDSKKRDLEKLTQEWIRLEKETSRVLFVGDFNRVDETHPTVWDGFLSSASCIDVDPKLITYQSQDVASALDRCLLPAEWVSSASWNPSIRTLSTASSAGHKILRISMQLKPSVVNNPKDPKHEVLPSDLFMPGKHPNAAKQSDIQALVRLLHRETQYDNCCTSWYQSLAFARQSQQIVDGLNRSSLLANTGIREDMQSYLPVFTSRHLPLSACFWAWWRTQEVPKANAAVAPHLLARKYLKGTQPWVNIPVWIIEDLIKQTRGAVIQTVEHLPVVQGACSIPRVVLQDCFDVIDTLQENVSYVPMDEVSMQAKGLGNMLSFWERMRNVCPKVNSYNGPILNRDNQCCVTSRDLDEAMLETRNFWFDVPNQFDDAWQPLLEVYKDAPRWPAIPPPGREVCLSTLLHTKDSAPGPDGIPYSAWRVLPETTLQAMSSYFYDIQEETALPPMQIGVWIPKAKMGPKADNFRPLGMPNTLDRLVDGTVAAHLMYYTAHLLHPSQTVMSYFKEPQRAVAEIQRILDGDHPACALLADLSKAFERVNPYWIMHLLRLRGAPR